MLNSIIRFFLENRFVAVLSLTVLLVWGLITAPFNWSTDLLPRDPVPVDAIPDIGENQQIVFTEWMGRSPMDVEDQITYPLSSALLGLPGVKTVRSSSAFGFSSIYIIFNEDVEFYWSRSRILEKLNSLPPGLLPAGVQPKLGPDATALGQVFLYTLEGRDQEGKPAGGWDLHELRSLQDVVVRPALSAVEGVAEVAPTGGYIKEYQVDVDPEAMKAFGVDLRQVAKALADANLDLAANTIEYNGVEYLIRGLGYMKELGDLDKAVVKVTDAVPVRVMDVANVTIGPQPRSMAGILDKEGTETVGGVVVARYGDNPREIIANVKDAIETLSVGLPSRTLEDGRVSKVTVVPYYDRSGLIEQTLDTLSQAIRLQVLITVIVIVVMVYNLRASLLISVLLPVAVLMCFILMRYVGVDANIVALSGIAIAIGTMVDLGIILNENILRHLHGRAGEKEAGETPSEATAKAAAEVAPALLTAVSTTVVSFLPVFTLQGAEGKLFGPLAFTKTFALLSALVLTVALLPSLSAWLFSWRIPKGRWEPIVNHLLLAIGPVIALLYWGWAGWVLFAFGLVNVLLYHLPERFGSHRDRMRVGVSVGAAGWLLATEWLPLGVSHGVLANVVFIALLLAAVLGFFALFLRLYPRMLGWCLANKGRFLLAPLTILLLAATIWLGVDRVLGVLPATAQKLGWDLRQTNVWVSLQAIFPGLDQEFMPSLDEGSFLLMPTSMPHSGVQVNREVLSTLNRIVASIPEVDQVVGKAGRAETPLDPAPMSMFEITISYTTEYATDPRGRKLRFKVDREGRFVLRDGQVYDPRRDQPGSVVVEQLIADPKGEYFRLWRGHITSPDDIWREIVALTEVPGVTSSPKLQPIQTRLVMLQTGLRAPMGLKVFGPDLETVQEFALQLEEELKQVPSLEREAIFADRILGKPYLEIDIDRDRIARHGLSIRDVQDELQRAVAGVQVGTTVEGRERYPIRVRYAREFRDDPSVLEQVLVSTPSGGAVPLMELAQITYRIGPEMIRGENGSLVGYVLMDARQGVSETRAVEDAQSHLRASIASGALAVPAGVRFEFSGTYENQVRASKRLSVVIPLSLMIIFLILYAQFRAVSTSLFVFSGIAIALSGGFVMLWLYAQPWFLDISILGTSMRELFQVRAYNLSVAVWVGFIALFGIATDDGVLVATTLRTQMRLHRPTTVHEIRAAVLAAGSRRVLPAMMTTASTLLALLPILTSSGRGADIMIPMAIPSFGGMSLSILTVFLVPVLYCWWAERCLLRDPDAFQTH